MDTKLEVTTGYKGLLFIGDPHLASTKIGRRLDKSFARTVLGKLSQAATICREEKLYPVLLGDLFHSAGENDLEVLDELLDVLAEFPDVPLTPDGNHDKKEIDLKAGDALAFLRKAKQIHVVGSTEGPVRQFEFEDGLRVNLWVLSYGMALPEGIPVEDGTVNVMITHMDMGFQGAYPGAAELHEIPGCHMLVNGHMHKFAPSVTCGMTRLHCPGNITRLSIDTAEHVPSVWGWTPDQLFELEQMPLQFVKDIWDRSGILVEAAGEAAVIASLGASRFATELAAMDSADTARTDDGSAFQEDLAVAIVETDASEGATAMLLALQVELESEGLLVLERA